MWRRTMVLGVLSLIAVQEPRWSAVRLVRIGEEEGVSLGRISSVAAAPGGRFFVLDGMESRVHVFSAAGKLERTFGRRGRGPGELSNLASQLVLWRDQVVIIDPGNQRLSVFTTDGSYKSSRPLDLTQSLAAAWVVAGDRLVYLARPMPAAMAAQMGGITKHTVFALDLLSNAAPSRLLELELPPENEVAMGAAVSVKVNLRVPQLALAADGATRLLLAADDAYRIRMFTADGRTTGWLSRSVTRRRYTPAELARKKQQADSLMRAAYQSGAGAARGSNVPGLEIEFVMPEFVPVLTALFAGDRFALVARDPEDDDQPTEWDVLSYDGKLAGTLVLPANFRIRAWSGDRVYGVEKDEFDVESIAIYRIGARR